MKLYERLGFLRSKRLHRYYLNGNSAFRFVLFVKENAAEGRNVYGHEYDEIYPPLAPQRTRPEKSRLSTPDVFQNSNVYY